MAGEPGAARPNAQQTWVCKTTRDVVLFTRDREALEFRPTPPWMNPIDEGALSNSIVTWPDGPLRGAVHAAVPAGAGDDAAALVRAAAAGIRGVSADTGIGSFLAANAGFSPLFATPHDEVSSTTSLYPVLGLGDRYSIVPALAARAEDFPQLKFRELTGPVLTRKICLITRRLRSLSPSARRIMDILLETFRTTPLPPGVALSQE